MSPATEIEQGIHEKCQFFFSQFEITPPQMSFHRADGETRDVGGR